MIVKKIKNPAKSASKATRVNGLANYIAAPEKSNTEEKCVHQGSRGFLTESFEAQKAEMLALAQEAVRSRDPISHYVMSWKENEQPSPAQVEEAVGIFLKEMGLEDHQAIYGLHADTANLHVHVMVNRVHPDSLRVIKPNKGFDIDAAHRAIARIEHVQGWERERHGRYQVLDTGEVERGQREQWAHDSAHGGIDRLRQPEQAKRDMEERTGEKSAERIAIEEAAPILREATSWSDVHRRLAEIGMRYEKVGSGAVVFIGDVGVKASRTDRAASLSKIEKRLGQFAPVDKTPDWGVSLNKARKVDTSIAPLRSPIPIAKGVAGWPEYIDGRRAHYAAKTVAVEDQKRRHLLERRELSDAQQAARRGILVNGPDAGKQSFRGVWKGRGELRQAMQSILAAEQAGERANLKDRHQVERALLRGQFAPYPDFEVWLRERGQPELAERWRYRDRSGRDQDVEREGEQAISCSRYEVPRITGAAAANESENSLSTVIPPRDIRNYVAYVRENEVHYSRRATAHSAESTSNRPPVAAFVDKGCDIEVHDWRSDDSLLAALQLSAQKWGAISVIGSDDYKARCAALAVEHGLRIVNPELQADITQGREAKRLDRTFLNTSSSTIGEFRSL
ncbi:TraI/MobA(P) family conjugative relaxase [Caballeronia grimmiae]|uniref:TraI/MobA(P) family conjugative relaxase n=1 Tax=Caballeronia grimmiae TaxID=1071679 RepID=UPI0038B8B2B8